MARPAGRNKIANVFGCVSRPAPTARQSWTRYARGWVLPDTAISPTYKLLVTAVHVGLAMLVCWRFAAVFALANWGITKGWP